MINDVMGYISLSPPRALHRRGWKHPALVDENIARKKLGQTQPVAVVYKELLPNGSPVGAYVSRSTLPLRRMTDGHTMSHCVIDRGWVSLTSREPESLSLLHPSTIFIAVLASHCQLSLAFLSFVYSETSQRFTR